MIEFANGGRLIQPGDQMPELPETINELYLDFETTSRDPDKKSTNPWHDCWPLGFAVTWDDHPYAYYIPIEHARHFEGKGSLDNAYVAEWLKYLFAVVEYSGGKWINHNIKYDVHVLRRHYNIEVKIPVICTLTLAKIIDSDRKFRGGYGLDILAYAWCGIDIGIHFARIQPYLAGAKYYKQGISKKTGKPTRVKISNKDYGRVPVDLMAEYACGDVLANRPVWHYIDENCPPESRDVFNTEIEQTFILCEMEAEGMRVDPLELGALELMVRRELIDLYEFIHTKTGRYLNPASSKDCFQYLCQTCGLPVLKWTNEEDEEKESNPSFGKDILEKYLAYPNAPHEVIRAMVDYRSKDKFVSSFVSPYRHLNNDGIIHPTYNQSVRTGRMSCSAPNMQQLNKRAKALFKPREGNSFLVIDYSQVEFRLIVHYINDQNAINAYQQDPRTDFHRWMAELCKIARNAAKKMNFLIGYGGGKAKTQSALTQVEDIITAAQSRVAEEVERGRIRPEMSVDAYDLIVGEIATMAYTTYHARLPALKRTSRNVEQAARARIKQYGKVRLGHVINLYGRHRHLPPDRCHIGFNSICQSSAADLIKERTVALFKALKGTGIKIIAQVHDALVLEGPTEILRDARTINDITWIMENPAIKDKLRVPIKTNAGISSETWYDADLPENDCTVDPVEPVGGVPFTHLKENVLTSTVAVEYTTAVPA